MGVAPKEVPFPWSGDDLLTDAYKRGWSHGHGLACHNVPKLGQKLHLETLGRVYVDEENIREVIAFPKTQSGSDPMTNAPTTVNPAQLAELGIRLLPPPAKS
jgi:hypothetical protein